MTAQVVKRFEYCDQIERLYLSTVHLSFAIPSHMMEKLTHVSSWIKSEMIAYQSKLLKTFPDFDKCMLV